MICKRISPLVSRSGCGVDKLCIETPQSCDPSNSSSPCLFTSAVVTSTDIGLSLSGESEGYVALGLTNSSSMIFEEWVATCTTVNISLSKTGNHDATSVWHRWNSWFALCSITFTLQFINEDVKDVSVFFVCGKRSGTFFFETAQRNNSLQNAPLTKSNMTVEEVKGELAGNVTKCTFKVQRANLKRATNSDTMFEVILGTGPVNGNDLGALKVDLKTEAIDLSNVTTVITTTAAPTTTATTVPGGAVRASALLTALILPLLLTFTLMT
ncbi:hypothetical protein WMY93_000714 [Mugilogobius chulae]|uniref:Ferric-chelate reductase 1 n=1 Tax=Mugilogobius chulae TaxID=88201 RepID=A0AAW0PZP8_9GOBI